MSSNPSDFQQLAAMGPAGAGDAGPGQDVQQALAPQMDSFRQLGANLGVANEAQQAPIPPTGVKFNPQKQTVDITGLSQQAYEGFLRDQQQLSQIRGSFAMEAERLRQREEQVRNQSPWIQLATALAANMAQAKDLPGWVQAAGRTSAQLNPQPDEIRNQRLGVLSKEAEMTEKSAGLNIAQARTLEGMADRAESKAAREHEQGLQQENRQEDNYRQVQQKIESEVITNKRVTPEQEEALRVIGTQTGRAPKRIEADLARLRSGARASAEALAEQRTFEMGKAREVAREADQRLNKTLTAQDRRQAQGQLVTTLIPLYKEASWQTKDQEVLQGMSKLDQTFESFMKEHGVAGGPAVGRAAKLMAVLGDPNAQKLLRDEAQVLIDVLNSSGLSFAKTSEKEMQAIFSSLPRATNNPKVALDTALRYQKWGDDVRKRYLQERYAGQFSVVAPYMPTQPLLNGEARPDWRKIQETHRSNVAKPGTLEEKVLNLPQLMNQIGGESGLATGSPQASALKPLPYLVDGKPIFEGPSGTPVFADGSPVPKKKK